VLGLNDDAGFNKMKGYVTNDVIKKCRMDCVVEYPIDEPIILPPPPKDPELGMQPSNPASSCQDIITNGGKPNPGVYFISVKKKEPFSAYCEQLIDGGGWTLFFAYSHHPFEDYDIDSTTLPDDPKNGRSHMSLEQLGWSGLEVRELRFFCTTTHQVDKQ